MSNTNDDCVPPEPPNRPKLDRLAASGIGETAQHFLNKPIAESKGMKSRITSQDLMHEFCKLVMPDCRKNAVIVELSPNRFALGESTSFLWQGSIPITRVKVITRSASYAACKAAILWMPKDDLLKDEE